MTPEEWEKKESPVVDYVKDGEVIYGQQGVVSNQQKNI